MTPEKALDVEEMKTGWWRTAETLLRVTSMGLCVVSLTVMLKNTQSNEYGSLSYSDLSGFQYIVYANGICVVYSLVSAFYFAVHRPLTLARAWAFFLLDQVMTYLVLTAAAAATETLFLAFGTTFCYIAISLLSSFRLFSTYEDPLPFLIGKSAGIAAFP